MSEHVVQRGPAINKFTHVCLFAVQGIDAKKETLRTPETEVEELALKNAHMKITCI